MRGNTACLVHQEIISEWMLTCLVILQHSLWKWNERLPQRRSCLVWGRSKECSLMVLAWSFQLHLPDLHIAKNDVTSVCAWLKTDVPDEAVKEEREAMPIERA